MTNKLTFQGILVLLFLSLISYGQADFHVSVLGDDNNPGTIEKSFASSLRGKENIRDLLSRGQNTNITVWIHNGTYQVSDPLLFKAEDSGKGSFNLSRNVFPGENPPIRFNSTPEENIVQENNRVFTSENKTYSISLKKIISEWEK